MGVVSAMVSTTELIVVKVVSLLLAVVSNFARCKFYVM